MKKLSRITMIACLVVFSPLYSFSGTSDLEADLMAESMTGELHKSPSQSQQSEKNHTHSKPGKNAIQIKGLWIGMDQDEVNEKFDLPIEKFTIAGVEGKSRLGLRFDENKLQSIYFTFDSKSFQEVADSVKGKYPDMRCNSSTVGNAIGAVFEQINCYLTRDNATLFLSRLSSDISTSTLLLCPEKSSKEIFEEQKRKMNDI